MITIEEYRKRKKEMNGGKGYKDPDTFGEDYNKNFYETYCDKLNEKLRKLKENNEYGRLITIDRFFFDKELAIKGILVFIKKDNLVLHLKSDQFGFSVDDSGNKPNKYPYFNYLNVLPGKNLDKGFENVFGKDGWINKTRQVGGSFLWPLESNGDTPYNTLRGGSLLHKEGDSAYYIQDRVDLTLYEIKEIYEKIIEPSTNNKLIGCLYNTNMYKFLKAFGSFEIFTKVFGFYGNFVTKDLEIVNILPFKNDENDKEKLDSEYIKKAREGKKLMIASYKDNEIETNISVEDMERMFNKVCDLIEKRREILYNKEKK